LLSAHDSYRFFAALGDLAITGPTLTNVNDIRDYHYLKRRYPDAA
jgi:hydroxypyruvate reductase